jgi:aspartyl-tRNA(Asn)/glutamyl-tRNA(Gln) amidotransferase subunit C
MISKDEVKHIAGLARIGLAEKDVEKFSHDLSSILDWIAQLEEVNVDGAKETAHITGLKNVSREDKAREFDGKEEIKKLFPEEKSGYDKVKSVL